MAQYEYQVIAAPQRGAKAKSLKTPDDRFAAALASALNEQARHGWEFLRAETLPSEERQGLTGTRTVFHNMLVFRRALGGPEPDAQAPVRLIEDQSDDAGAPGPG